MSIAVRQINQSELALFVQQISSGAAFSGNLINYVQSSGFLGPTVVWTTGGNQNISGAKTFIQSPIVPYSGGTGTVASTLWIIDQINNTSGQLYTYIQSSGSILYNWLTGISGNSQGGGVGTGYSGYVEDTFVHRTAINESISGNKTFIGTGTFSLTLLVSSPILPSGAVNLSYLSGVSGVLAAGGGGGTSINPTGRFVPLTGDVLISGIKTFTGSPQVPDPILPSGVVNLNYLSGVSGILYSQLTGVSGAAGQTINNFYITGTGTINNTFNASGNITNTFVDSTTNVNVTQITGNFNIASFFFDPTITGLNIAESFVGGMGYYFTGAAFACRTSGSAPTNGGILSGKLYQVDSNNTEQTLYNFTFTTGIIYSGSPGFNIYVTGRNRIGVSITNSLSGIQKMSIGIFGGSYV